MEEARDFRRSHSDSYNFNWLLKIPPAFQHPFEVSHDSMRALRLYRDQPAHELARICAARSRASSPKRQGNGVRAIEKLGPYELTGDASVMKLLDELLAAFVAQKRMKLPGSAYRPCYRLVA